MTFTCGTCWREFPSGWQARNQHLNATGHREPQNECYVCDRVFGSPAAVNQHMNALGHWGDPTYQCNDCSDAFFDEEDLRDHEVDVHYFCDPCDRYFRTRNAINMHLNSRAHLPQSSIRCLFCGDTYTTATGLVHHIERGACPQAPVDRARLYDAVRRRDPNGILTKHLLGWSGEPDCEATSMAWNSACQAYMCYLCRRLFNTLPSLNQHLKSPVHQQSLYHCPNRSCHKDFTTLAAVINHLESESCQFMRFDAVQQAVERIIDPTRMIRF